jgi:transcriptional regulator with XRE-family HTH domain
MDDARSGRLVRVLRHSRAWRQVDLATRAGVGSTVVSNLERGQLGPMTIATIRSILGVFGLSLEVSVRGLGADEDRILDRRHAELLGACAAWLKGLGWQTRAEVSYSEYGERGSIDLLAWRDIDAMILVIEIKTELASIESTLRKLDEKARLGPTIASRLGWRPATVSRLLVLPNDRTQRRRVDAHVSVLGDAYPTRGRAAKAWCRTPSGPISGLIYLTEPGVRRVGSAGGRRQRIRSRACDPHPSPRDSPAGPGPPQPRPVRSRVEGPSGQ